MTGGKVRVGVRGSMVVVFFPDGTLFSNPFPRHDCGTGYWRDLDATGVFPAGSKLSDYPTCQFVMNTDALMESIFDGQDKPLPEEIRCGRRAFFCFNSYHRNHTDAVRLLLPILDPEHANEHGWEREHNREEWLARFREKVGDDADHWYFLCPRHWLYHKCLRITIGIEDYISYYIWRGFCWHAPWDQLKRLFIRNPKGDR